MGRGDARNFSGGYGHMPPPDSASSRVGTDDLRRLGSANKSRVASQQSATFGPSSMFGSRSNSGRKAFGPGGALTRGGEDSAASSRSGTTGAKKDEKESASTNAFRYVQSH